MSIIIFSRAPHSHTNTSRNSILILFLFFSSPRSPKWQTTKRFSFQFSKCCEMMQWRASSKCIEFISDSVWPRRNRRCRKFNSRANFTHRKWKCFRCENTQETTVQLPPHKQTKKNNKINKSKSFSCEATSFTFVCAKYFVPNILTPKKKNLKNLFDFCWRRRLLYVFMNYLLNRTDNRLWILIIIIIHIFSIEPLCQQLLEMCRSIDGTSILYTPHCRSHYIIYHKFAEIYFSMRWAWFTM